MANLKKKKKKNTIIIIIIIRTCIHIRIIIYKIKAKNVICVTD